MKDWQHGYDLEYLKGLAEKYKHYNSFTYSPFAQVKKNNIAEGLHKRTLMHLYEDTLLDVVHVKSKGNITMHGDTVIGVKQKGDVVFSKMTGNPEILNMEIIKYNQDAWMYVWAEDKVMNDFAESIGFCKVAPKITSFGEMYMIYYRGKKRVFPKVDPAEYQSICKIKDIDVEVYVQPSFDKHHSLGIYSILDNRWISKPVMGAVKIDDSDVQAKVDNYLNKIMQALVDDDIDRVKEIQQEISKIRKAGLEQGGEFSIENIAYKVLRAKGFIEQLRQHIYKLQDRALSLGEQS